MRIQTAEGDWGWRQVRDADNVRFTMRSLEGIFVYLGEVARTQMGLAGAEPATLANVNGGADSDFAVGDPRDGPVTIF